MGTEQTREVKSVGRAFEILERLEEDGPTSVTTIASDLHMPVSTVHNHLSTLVDEGYVRNSGGTYELGLRFLELGGHVRNETELFEHGRSPVDQLAAETGELANLMIEEGGRGIHIYLARGDEAFQFDTHAGMRFYLHNNALGKAILSGFPPSRVDEVVEQHGLPATTENTVSEREVLDQRLDTIRERGYAFDDEERLDGLRCVAAPISVDERVVGSVSVSGPASRLKGDRFREELPEKVVRTADLIGIQIEYP